VQISHPNFVFKLYIKKTLHTSTTCGLPFVSSARPSIITESALVLRKIAPQVGTSSSPSKTSFTERPMCLSAFLNQKPCDQSALVVCRTARKDLSLKNRCGKRWVQPLFERVDWVHVVVVVNHDFLFRTSAFGVNNMMSSVFASKPMLSRTLLKNSAVSLIPSRSQKSTVSEETACKAPNFHVFRLH